MGRPTFEQIFSFQAKKWAGPRSKYLIFEKSEKSAIKKQESKILINATFQQ